jgi:hypothetical protein
MIGKGIYFYLLFKKTWDIAVILPYRTNIEYFKKYWHIEIAREILILLSINQKIFGNIVIDIVITNMAQPYFRQSDVHTC